jgi:hypothetical protein
MDIHARDITDGDDLTYDRFLALIALTLVHSSLDDHLEVIEGTFPEEVYYHNLALRLREHKWHEFFAWVRAQPTFERFVITAHSDLVQLNIDPESDERT